VLHSGSFQNLDLPELWARIFYLRFYLTRRELRREHKHVDHSRRDAQPKSLQSVGRLFRANFVHTSQPEGIY